jgi:hypothetical protein
MMQFHVIYMCSALPMSSRRAAIRTALDTGHVAGINEQLVMETDGWEDIPEDFGIPGLEAEVDPSHEGGDYLEFNQLVHDTLSRYVFSQANKSIYAL